MSAELSDTPLNRPEDDLLGVAPSAKILAGRLAAVQPPYTAGVYGEWGSGKSTFVSFVAEYLERLAPRLPSGGSSTLFVPFSAWQYKTADEIWRALILTIARRILNVPEPAGQPLAAAPPRLGLWERIKALLGTDALVLRHEQLLPDAQSRYIELVDKLDASLYGGISKSAPGMDTTETTIAVAKSVVAAMSGASPMVAGIRGVFGFNTDVDFGKLIDKGQNESTRQRIESMEEFKSILRELFDGERRRVFVFVDDLDRCMPDAALDLLEAIKIFLPSTPCVFVVAADETLIGQGLRMRFRDVVDPTGSGDVNAFMNKKGREYFEKIIQLPVHLPRPGADEIHRFIGARFPEWFAATDLIDAAIGSNPRRLKQYCNRLEYRRLISQPAEARP
jgi:predicted KAP-like P-loop ATPase